jgi:hypothetical protein
MTSSFPCTESEEEPLIRIVGGTALVCKDELDHLSDPDLLRILAHQLPHRALGQRVLAHRAVRRHSPEDRTFLNSCRLEPLVDCLLHPQRPGHRSHLVSLPHEIRKYPAAVAHAAM